MSGTAHRRDRRRLMGAAALGPMAAIAPRAAHARGAGQLEEPLIDSVRSALSSAIANAAPPKPAFASAQSQAVYTAWRDAMSQRLRGRKPDEATRTEFLETVWYESKRAGLSPEWVLGVIQVESGFRKYAISPVGARGYMQVMPFWARLIGNGDVTRLFHLQTNLRFGCVILRHYLDIERGDLAMALGRYNGSRGRPEYPRLVVGAKRQWDWTHEA